MDKYDKKTRSKVMAAVTSRGNKATEIRMAKILRKNGLKGWRRHYQVAGTPDFAWPKYKVALFVDGCFWHGCPRCYREPKSNVKYWRDKVQRNQRRDRRVSRTLREKGWSVIRVWECCVSKESAIKRIARVLSRHGGK